MHGRARAAGYLCCCGGHFGDFARLEMIEQFASGPLGDPVVFYLCMRACAERIRWRTGFLAGSGGYLWGREVVFGLGVSERSVGLYSELGFALSPAPPPFFFGE